MRNPHSPRERLRRGWARLKLWPRRLRSKLKGEVPRQLPREKLHEYWRSPWDVGNLPQEYVKGEERSRFLVRLLAKYVGRDARILEIGCNIGRNLHFLHEAGFRKLEGIEINEEAVALLRKTYPELARDAQVHNAAVEDVIRRLPDRDFDVVFTLAVLEHLHKDSEWVFKDMARITGSVLVTIEDERNVSLRHFARDYRAIFESLGMRQVETVAGSEIPGLSDPNFVARVFRRAAS